MDCKSPRFKFTSRVIIELDAKVEIKVAGKKRGQQQRVENVDRRWLVENRPRSLSLNPQTLSADLVGRNVTERGRPVSAIIARRSCAFRQNF